MIIGAFPRLARRRPAYYSQSLCLRYAELDGEAAAYHAQHGQEQAAYAFAEWAARFARWSAE